LLERNDPRQVAAAFNENAKHTLEFMASNQVATAQRWFGTISRSRASPGAFVEAISERCRLAVSDEKTISQTPAEGHTNSNKQGRNRA